MKNRWLLSDLKKVYDGKSSAKGSVRSGVDVLLEGGLVAQCATRSRKLLRDIKVVDASRLYRRRPHRLPLPT